MTPRDLLPPSPWTRRAVLLGACSALGLAVRFVDVALTRRQWRRAGWLPDPRQRQDEAAERGTLAWARKLLADRPADVPRYWAPFLAVVRQHPAETDLWRGCDLLVDAALLDVSSGDTVLHATLLTLSSLGQKESVAAVARRLTQPESFPRSSALLRRSR